MSPADPFDKDLEEADRLLGGKLVRKVPVTLRSATAVQMRKAVLAFLRLKLPAAVWTAVEPPGAFVHGKPVRNPEGDEGGMTDIVGCYEALYVGIECKTRNDRVKEHQGEHGNRVAAGKGLAVVIHEATWLQDCELLVGLLTQTTHIVPNWPHYLKQLNLERLQWPSVPSPKPAGGSSTSRKRLPTPG